MIYLASASPRRRELLAQVGIGFEALASDLHEERAAGESPRAYVARVAADKARHVAGVIAARRQPARPVLGADTEVVVDDDILGKPRDRTHAAQMLARLAGRTHTVLTGLCLVTSHGEHAALSESRVTFAPLTATEIDRYVASGEADDKAGGYAIQGRAAGFIAHLDGSYSGVMGLPLYELCQTFRRAGLEWP
jgi:septum formation protein